MALSRTTVYLNPKVFRAAKVRCALTDRSFSTVVNDALRMSLREDEMDLRAFDSRRGEKSRPFEMVLSDLKKSGLI